VIDIVSSAVILAWVAILILALAMAGVLRQVRALASGRPVGQQQLGPANGSVAPSIPGLAQLVHPGRITVLLFLDGTCEVCGETLRAADEMAEPRADLVRFVALFAGDAGGASLRHAELLEHSNQVFARYGVPLVPFAVAVAADGRVVDSGAVGSPTLLREFVVGVTTIVDQYARVAAGSTGAIVGANSSRG
jgi:hypothetical protein